MATTAHTLPPGFAAIENLPEITASELKKQFGKVVRLAAREPVAISRHNRREFVILTTEQYEEFLQNRLAPLESLASDFDRMLEKINTPEDQAGRASFFQASAVKSSTALTKLKRQRAHAR